MLEVLGGLLSSKEQGGLTYSVFFIVADLTDLPEIAHGDSKMPVLKIWPSDRQCFRKIRPLACRERFPVAGPGKAHGRPRTALFVLACILPKSRCNDIQA